MENKRSSSRPSVHGERLLVRPRSRGPGPARKTVGASRSTAPRIRSTAAYASPLNISVLHMLKCAVTVSGSRARTPRRTVGPRYPPASEVQTEAPRRCSDPGPPRAAHADQSLQSPRLYRTRPSASSACETFGFISNARRALLRYWHLIIVTDADVVALVESGQAAHNNASSPRPRRRSTSASARSTPPWCTSSPPVARGSGARSVLGTSPAAADAGA